MAHPPVLGPPLTRHWHIAAIFWKMEAFVSLTYHQRIARKIESAQQCGSPGYDKFTYTNPGNGAIKSLLSVDYDARQAYEQAKTGLFRAYKAVLLFLWLVGMLVELREVTEVLTWCMRF